MADKTAYLSCRLDSETKRKLKEKADELGLDITEFITQIAEKPVVILDNNIKNLFEAIKFEIKEDFTADSNTNFK